MKPDLMVELGLTAGSFICAIGAVLHVVTPVGAGDALAIGTRELLARARPSRCNRQPHHQSFLSTFL